MPIHAFGVSTKSAVTATAPRLAAQLRAAKRQAATSATTAKAATTRCAASRSRLATGEGQQQREERREVDALRDPRRDQRIADPGRNSARA